MSGGDEQSARTGVLMWAGLALIVMPALARMMIGTAVVAYWDVSPLETSLPEAVLTHADRILLDAITWVGAAMVLLACRSIARWAIGALAIAGVGVFVQGWVRAPVGGAAELSGSLEDALVGSAWLAAAAGAVGVWHAARESRSARAAVTAALVGGAVLLGARALWDLTLGYDLMVADFRANPAASLAAQGIEAEGEFARSFERRLLQRVSIGWFGLSNVLSTVLLIGALITGWLAVIGSRAQRLWFGALAVVFAGIVVVNGSKGAIGALLFGVGVIVAGQLCARGRPRLERLDRWGAMVLPAVALAGPTVLVLVRGMVGERIGELSLLFRFHYLVAAGRMFAGAPVFGVGPGEFQEAYTTAKVPTNPEDVAFAHGVLPDWLAGLGAAGIGLVAIFVVCAVFIGRAWAGSCARPAGAEEGFGEQRTEVGRAWVLGVVGVTTAGALVFQAATLAQSMVVFGGLGVLIGMAAAQAAYRTLSASHSGVWLGVAGAALAACAHGQIEMTGVLPASGAWWWLVIGVAAGVPRRDRDRSGSVVTRVGGGVLALLVAGALGGFWMQTARYEHGLREAADEVGVIGQATLELRLERLEGAAALLGGALGEPVARTPEAILFARRRLLAQRTSAAERHLLEAEGAALPTPEPRRFAINLRLMAGQGEDALRLALELTERWPGRGGSWMALGNAFQANGEAMEAADAFARAAEAAPFAVVPAEKAALGFAAAGDRASASRWAGEALRRDELRALDPLVRMGEARAARLRGLAELDARGD